jgi:hypothetical protein
LKIRLIEEQHPDWRDLYPAFDDVSRETLDMAAKRP